MKCGSPLQKMRFKPVFALVLARALNPHLDRQAATMDASEGVKLGAVVTLVCWLGCVTVGLLGLVLQYQRPHPPAPEPSPVQAAKVEVEIIKLPLTIPASPPALVASLAPSPTPAPMVLPEAPPLLPVAAPSPALAFPLPVEGPTRVVSPAQAAYVRPAAEVKTSSPSPPAQPLVFGRGEGKQPAPEYPRAALRAGQEGTVRIGLAVDENGLVLDAQVLAPSPWPLLNEAALRTVRQRWRFAPGPLRRYEVPIRFQLQK